MFSERVSPLGILMRIQQETVMASFADCQLKAPPESVISIEAEPGKDAA